MRYLFYNIYTKSESGVISGVPRPIDQLEVSIAAGLGNGMLHSAIMYTSILWESTGPGSLFLPSCTGTSIFVISAFMSLCWILYHIFWSVIAFEGFRLRNWFYFGFVVITHLVASLFSIINTTSVCGLGVVFNYLLLAGVIIATVWQMRKYIAKLKVQSVIASQELTN